MSLVINDKVVIKGVENMKPNKQAVAERIKIIRNDLNLSIAGMAEKIGISKSTLNSYIRALAMPPEDLVEKISIMSGSSKEWIYYGDEKAYIKEILISKGYNPFLDDYPETVEKVCDACEKGRVFPIVNKYPHELTVLDFFYQIYNPIFEEYIATTIEKYSNEISKYPLYTGSEEYNKAKYVNRVKMLIGQMHTQIKYGDSEKIIQIAEDEFKNRVDFYSRTNKKTLKQVLKLEKEPSFLPNMVEKLSANKGVTEIIDYLAFITKEEFKKENDVAYEVIEAFKELGVKLDAINKKYSAKEIAKVFPKQK